MGGETTTCGRHGHHPQHTSGVCHLSQLMIIPKLGAKPQGEPWTYSSNHKLQMHHKKKSWTRGRGIDLKDFLFLSHSRTEPLWHHSHTLRLGGHYLSSHTQHPQADRPPLLPSHSHHHRRVCSVRVMYHTLLAGVAYNGYSCTLPTAGRQGLP